MDPRLTSISRFMSLILRHEPQTIGLSLDAEGWADVDELIAKARAHGKPIDRETLECVVTENDKQRFAFNTDRSRIRANQGHSVDIDLALSPSTPPARLFHGTAAKNIASIRASGLNSGERQHVHLSPDPATATKVGARHGVPVVLVVRTAEMVAKGHPFYLSQNGVWLTARVPPTFIDFP